MTATPTATTRPIRALGHHFDVTASSSLARHVDHVFAALATTQLAPHHYELRTEPAADETPMWDVRLDGERLRRFESLGGAYTYLCWHVNRQALDGCHDRLLLHAACAADERGRAVLLPAEMESGKTTTVAGLVRDGLAYVTDEATVLDVDDGTIEPYPKPLSVDRGSWTVLADLRPHVAPELVGSQWQVPGQAVGELAGRSRPALVVSPQYVPGLDIEIERVSPAQTLMLLIHNTFNLPDFQQPGFHALEKVARSCPGYRLRHGRLDLAVDAIRGLLDDLEQAP
ncbi:MAG TPA: hypothetical protein DCS55_15075 [Acidimicrobiaceae bacterium]|nr:hypothetical protein [Acidimicrobiaceae bacterium]